MPYTVLVQRVDEKEISFPTHIAMHKDPATQNFVLRKFYLKKIKTVNSIELQI